jgi:DNA-binding transcriptional MocR family regulator
MARRKALLNHGCPWLEQAVLARLFEYGDYSRHLYKLRRRYRAQRDALLAGLRSIWGDDCQISGASTGMHLALHLPTDSPPADEIVQCALANGIRLPAAGSRLRECIGEDRSGRAVWLCLVDDQANRRSHEPAQIRADCPLQACGGGARHRTTHHFGGFTLLK